MSNIIQLMRRILPSDQAILLPFDNWSKGGTAIDHRRGTQDNQTYSNPTAAGANVSTSRNLGYKFSDLLANTDDGILDGDASLVSRADLDLGGFSVRMKIDAGTWTDGNFRRAIAITTDGDCFCLMEKRDTNNRFRIQRRNSAPGSEYRNIDANISLTDWFWVTGTWYVGGNALYLYADGVDIGSTAGLSANADNNNVVEIGSGSGAFRPFDGGFQMAFLHDGNGMSYASHKWLSRYNED